MLTASQIDALRDASGQLLDPVTDFLIEDIAKRVAEAGQLTSTAAYGVWTAQRLGMSQKKLKKALQEKLDISEKELESLLKQAAKTGYNFDLSRLPTTQGIPFAANSSIQQIVAAAVKQAKKDLTNITRTMGFVGSDGKARELTKAYKKACDDAFMRTVTGAQDYNSAIRDALKGLSEKGIVSIDYASGKQFTVEAAVRQNIMGGMGLMQQQISQKNHDDMGCDGWEISAHANSAPDHEPFQGRQYTDKQYKALNNSLLRPIGTLNCGHAEFPIIMGVHSPQYTEEELEEFRQQNEKGVTVDGRHYTGYDATQRQRQLERAIRGQKRKILIDKTVGDEEKLQNDQIKLVRLRDEYARFSKVAGLPTQHARAEAAGFTWKDGKEAENVSKKQKNTNQIATEMNINAKSNIDITQNGKFQKLPYTYDQIEEYKKHIRPEYYAQRITHADNQVLWDKDFGYIQSNGYKVINAYKRGLVDSIDPRYDKTIAILDKRTSNPSLKHDYIGFRKVDANYLKDVLHLDIEDLMEVRRVKTKLGGRRFERVPKDKAAAEAISSAISNLVGTDGAKVTDLSYTSISLAEDINYFTHFPVQFEIQMPKGTKGLITDNYKESEFMAKPNSTIEILGSEVYNDGEKDCIRVFGRLFQD